MLVHKNQEMSAAVCIRRIGLMANSMQPWRRNLFVGITELVYPLF